MERRRQASWAACLSLDTKELSHKHQLLWGLIAELDTAKCPTVGAHQLSNVLENLAPLNQQALLDGIGAHFIRRLRAYGLSADYLNATSVLSKPLLCWFASNGCTESCKLLLDAGVNVNIKGVNLSRACADSVGQNSDQLCKHMLQVCCS